MKSAFTFAAFFQRERERNDVLLSTIPSIPRFVDAVDLWPTPLQCQGWRGVPQGQHGLDAK